MMGRSLMQLLLVFDRLIPFMHVMPVKERLFKVQKTLVIVLDVL